MQIPLPPKGRAKEDAPLIPELLQADCNPQTLCAALVTLFCDPAAREAQQLGLRHVAELLGANEATSPTEKAAALLLALLKRDAR